MECIWEISFTWNLAFSDRKRFWGTVRKLFTKMRFSTVPRNKRGRLVPASLGSLITWISTKWWKRGESPQNDENVIWGLMFTLRKVLGIYCKCSRNIITIPATYIQESTFKVRGSHLGVYNSLMGVKMDQKRAIIGKKITLYTLNWLKSKSIQNVHMTDSNILKNVYLTCAQNWIVQVHTSFPTKNHGHFVGVKRSLFWCISLWINMLWLSIIRGKSVSTFGFTSYARNFQKKQYLIFGEMRNIFF